MLCDPDYINRKLIGYIDYRQRLSEDTKRTYTYAATYEDFIKLIDKCNDIEHLKQIRYNYDICLRHVRWVSTRFEIQYSFNDFIYMFPVLS